MEWWQIAWAVMALLLIGPMAYRMIKGDPGAALRSVAGWLGFALVAAWIYQNTGVAEWWEAKHGGAGLRGAPPAFDAPPPQDAQPQFEEPGRFPGE